MELISEFNKEFNSLSCVIDVYRKYARLIHLKDKKVIKINDLVFRIFETNQNAN